MAPLSDDVSAVMARAVDRGVQQVIVPAYDRESWLTMAGLTHLPGVFPTLGLHPWVADQAGTIFRPLENRPPLDMLPPGEQTNLSAPFAPECSNLRLDLETAMAVPPPDFQPSPGHVKIPAPVAIGEIGLDYKIDYSAGLPGPDWQLPVLRTQLELAADHDLPVILHCRGAFEELLTEVARFGGKLKGVLHAYSRGSDPASRFIAAGLHVGLGGAITRDRAKRVRQAAVDLPLDKIVLETDAPSIGLDGVLPADTEPGHVRDIAEALAALRGETLDTIAEVTTRNAHELFQLPG